MECGNQEFRRIREVVKALYSLGVNHGDVILCGLIFPHVEINDIEVFDFASTSHHIKCL